jgi:hypothetical protein
MLKVTAKAPETATAMTCHQRLVIKRNGKGKQVQATASRRKGLRPCLSESAPKSGALRKERKPFKPWVRPRTSHMRATPKNTWMA